MRDRAPPGPMQQPFPPVETMPSPLVVEALREQLVRVLDWYRLQRPAFGWGVVLHQRDERGKLRFGAVTPSGESMLLSQPLLAGLAEGPCWLDGAVRVRLACRQVTHCHPWLDALERPDRPPLVVVEPAAFPPNDTRILPGQLPVKHVGGRVFMAHGGSQNVPTPPHRRQGSR